jgi:nitronate monooxygenase
VSDFLDRLGVELPVIQAGMGGGIAGGSLAGAVSAAGGLGTVGIMPPEAMEAELRIARELAAGAPVSANLLVPFTRRAHVELCLRLEVEAVVIHGGIDPQLIGSLAGGGALPLQTVGTPVEARRALAYGAAGLVVQGGEAGGHLVGVEPALDALVRVAEVAAGAPLWLAGGIAEVADVRRALDAGAEAAVAGTRFLLSDECAAHPGYKQRVLDSEQTLATMLFGLGWPMRHRVVPNAATERWCARDPAGPRAMRLLYRASSPLARLPMSLAQASFRRQRPGVPLFGPAMPLAGDPEQLLDAAALYAGETAARIDAIVPAAEAVTLLAGRHL